MGRGIQGERKLTVISNNASWNQLNILGSLSSSPDFVCFPPRCSVALNLSVFEDNLSSLCISISSSSLSSFNYISCLFSSYCFFLRKLHDQVDNADTLGTYYVSLSVLLSATYCNEIFFQVSKAHGGATASKQVAYLWAKSLGGDSAVKLLTKFGLLEAAIDYAAENWWVRYSFAYAKFKKRRV